METARTKAEQTKAVTQKAHSDAALACQKAAEFEHIELHVGMLLKPSFHYPSWRPELRARVDGWTVFITRQHVPCW